MTPKITSPADGDVIDLCPPITGVAPPQRGEVGYWIALRGWNSLYLVGRVAPLVERPKWELTNVNIGRPVDAGQQYHLMLVRTDDAATHNFDDRVKHAQTNLGVALPTGAQVVHEITVWRAKTVSAAELSACPH